MITLTLNIGYESAEGALSTLNTFPFVCECENTTEMFEWLRGEMFNIFTWSVNHHIPKSRLRLFMRIDTTDLYYEYKINCSNVREYRPFMSMSSEEIEALVRESKIDEVIAD